MRWQTALVLACVGWLIGAAPEAAADPTLTGTWRIEFMDDPGGPVVDACRFALQEDADGQVNGKLTGCGLGTDGVVAGERDPGSGAVAMWVVAPDDAACETYNMSGTFNGTDSITGTFQCTAPIPLAGAFVAQPCDPLTPGSCPGAAPLTMIRACTPNLSVQTCKRSQTGASRIKLRRLDGRFYDVAVRLTKLGDTTGGDFGDPLSDRDYVVCLYEAGTTPPTLLAAEPAFAATFCSAKPCWKARRRGFRYKNRQQVGGKLRSVSLGASAAGTGKVKVRGQMTTLRPPSTATPLELPLVVQVYGGEECWEAEFSQAAENDGERFTARESP